MKDSIELLRDAIKDTQSIIANQDLKARFLLALNIAFIAGVMFSLKLIYSFNLSFFMNFIINFFAGFIIIFNLYIIYLILFNVINPRNNSVEYIKNIPSDLSKETLFFPIPENDTFNFEKYMLIVDSLDSEEKYKKIYLLELLKTSIIRNLKISNFNKVIKYFNYLLTALFFYVIFLIIIFLIVK